MTKAIRFPGNYAEFRFLLGLFFCSFLLTGCFSSDFPPSYKETDISANIKKICREEYKLNVVPLRAGNTLWVYAPLDRLLHAEFGKNPDKVFDEEMIEKARNILTSISRVLLSSDKAPEFFVLDFADIKLGLDYSLTANLMDIKKSAAGGIPWTEANKRYVVGFEQSKMAINDTSGGHLKIYDIKLSEFLSRQIAQRVRIIFQEEPIKKYFILKGIDSGFQGNKFIFGYSVVRISEPKEKINISRKILEIITYCFKTYEFKDFSQVVIKDLSAEESSIYESKDIWARSIE